MVDPTDGMPWDFSRRTKRERARAETKSKRSRSHPQIGEGGTVGGGSTISKSTPDGQLTVARGKQVSIPGWRRPVKPAKGG